MKSQAQEMLDQIPEQKFAEAVEAFEFNTKPRSPQAMPLVISRDDLIKNKKCFTSEGLAYFALLMDLEAGYIDRHNFSFRFKEPNHDDGDMSEAAAFCERWAELMIGTKAIEKMILKFGKEFKATEVLQMALDLSEVKL